MYRFYSPTLFDKEPFKRAEKKAPGGGALFKFNLTIKGGTFIVKRRIII